MNDIPFISIVLCVNQQIIACQHANFKWITYELNIRIDPAKNQHVTVVTVNMLARCLTQDSLTELLAWLYAPGFS